MLVPKPDTGSCNTRVSLALIAPNEQRRCGIASVLAGTQARIVREFTEAPAGSALSRLVESDCDVILVDLDSGVQQGIELIEIICSRNAAVTVMACSTGTEGDVVIRAMQAGAREFLTEPLTASRVIEALVRASSRRSAAAAGRISGKLLVFRGAKGGTGVTTLATNFAVALTQESGGSVVLVDMHSQLGEVALSLGIVPRFSIVDALANAGRMDADFLSTLLTKHESGLAVLASPEEHGVGANRSLERGAEKLFRVLREEFAFVVVDAGSSSGNTPDPLFEAAERIYLVTEANLPALRNARRMISYFGDRGDRRLQIVLNRANSRVVEIDEASSTKALCRSPDWKIPNDYVSVRGAQNLGVTLLEQDRPISRVIRQMAKAACGGTVGHQLVDLSAALKGDKWKFWTSNSIRPLSTSRS
jgi:pilus assembly protein CpaE